MQQFIFRFFLSISLLLLSSEYTICASQHQNFDTLKNDTTKIILLNDSSFYYRNNKISYSLNLNNEALSLSKKLNFAKGQINALLIRGIIEKNLGRFQASLQYFIEARKLAEKYNYIIPLSSVFNNIGSLHQAMGDFNKANEYYKLSLNIELKIGNKQQISIRLYNIGTIYELSDSLNMALSFYYKSLAIEEEIDNKEGVFYALTGIAGVNSKLKKDKEASENLDKAFAIAEKIGHTNLFCVAQIEKGKFYISSGKYKEAIPFFEKAIDLAKQISYRNEIRVSYSSLCDAYGHLGNYEKAWEYSQKYISLNDSLNNIETKNKIQELQLSYETEKKEQRIHLLEAENKIQNIEIAHHLKFKWFFIILSSIAFLLLIIFKHNNRNKNKITGFINDKINQALLSNSTLIIQISFAALSGIYFYIYSILTNPFLADDISLPALRYIIILVIVFTSVFLSFKISGIFEKVQSNFIKRTFRFGILPVFNILFISLFILIFLKISKQEITFLFICSEVLFVSIVPLIIIMSVIDRIIQNTHEDIASVMQEEIEKQIITNEMVKKITINSENNKQQFSIDLEQLLFIKAEDNYCEVHYMLNEKTKREVIRITLKAIEQQIIGNDKVIRCHKSFMINILNIDRISGNSMGYKIHIKNCPEIIPVSRSFPKELLQQLKSEINK